MNILLAIDFSDSSELAVSEVGIRPWPRGSKICVLSVVDATSFIETPSLAQTAAAAAQSLVENAAQRLRLRGLETTTAVLHGHPRTDIPKYAKEWGANFLVVGSHGYSALTRFVMGSVAQAAVRHAPCSVEVVRAGTRNGARNETSPMKIFLATDGSECSIAAGRSVVERPWPDGTEVNVLSAISVVVPTSWYVDPLLIDELWADAEDKAQRAVREARAVLSQSRLKVITSVLRGDPRVLIVDQSTEWNADLVVLGSHGRRGLTRMFLGSVSETVVAHARCSVDVIR
jgi:nucleotide-binding universal stress UspA family protein